MLVVPLSSCITDTSDSSTLATNSNPNEMPTAPEGITLPGEYTITYHNTHTVGNLTKDGSISITDLGFTSEDPVKKSYNGTFAYALPNTFNAPDNSSVFAGWSKTDPSTLSVGDSIPSADIYQVYDDIKSDDTSTGELDLYAVWVPNEVTGADGKTYHHTIYVKYTKKEKEEDDKNKQNSTYTPIYITNSGNGLTDVTPV